MLQKLQLVFAYYMYVDIAFDIVMSEPDFLFIYIFMFHQQF